MALKKFKTDRRLWWRIAAALFAVSWFVPFFGKNAPPAWGFWLALFSDPGHLDDILMALGFYFLLFGVPAVLLGFVFQAAIIIAREHRKSSKNAR